MAKTMTAVPGGQRTAVYYSDNGVQYGSQMTYYLTYTSGRKKPISGVNHADMLYYFDWHSLTEEQKTACIAQVWMFDAEERAENLHLVFHLDAGIHHVGLFRQFVDFQLEHFIFGNGTDVVASFGIPIQRIGRDIVGRRNIEVGLCCG